MATLRFTGVTAFLDREHGTSVVGFKAFRWLPGRLEIKHPRRFRNEPVWIEIGHGDEPDRSLHQGRPAVTF